jgi:hypothetical protein
MNSPKLTDEDYINFIIATPREVTATEAERVQPESTNASSHDAFTRLLTRLEPDPETLWQEAQNQVELSTGMLILDDSTLEKPYSKFNALVYKHWSGKQKDVVAGINLITLLWSDGVRCIPIDYRVFDKDRDGKTKNEHFSDMMLAAFERGFNPELVCFDRRSCFDWKLETVPLFGLAFFDSFERESKDKGQRRQAASRLQCRVDGRKRNNCLAQRFWRDQGILHQSHKRHGGILGDQPQRNDGKGTRNTSHSGVANRNVSSSD